MTSNLKTERHLDIVLYIQLEIHNVTCDVVLSQNSVLNLIKPVELTTRLQEMQSRRNINPTPGKQSAKPKLWEFYRTNQPPSSTKHTQTKREEMGDSIGWRDIWTSCKDELFRDIRENEGEGMGMGRKEGEGERRETRSLSYFQVTCSLKRRLCLLNESCLLID